MPPYLMNKGFKVEREIIVTDGYGGSFVTGTTIISDFQWGRFDSVIPTQMRTLIQGPEVTRSGSILFHKNRQNPLPIRENDIITLISPLYDPDLGKRYRVRGLSDEAFLDTDPRGILELAVTRIDESRTNQTN